MKRVFLCAFTIVFASDPCTDLGSKLELGTDSFVEGSTCHWLYWSETPRSGNICCTWGPGECPREFPVTVEDAVRELALSKSSDISGSRPGPDEQIVVDTEPKDVEKVHIVAMGDCGVGEEVLRPTVKVLKKNLYEGRDATLLLGDLFYPRGPSGRSDPRFGELIGSFSAAGTGPVFAALGNHDRMGDWKSMIRYPDVRWRMPGAYYFERFAKQSFSVCMWFLDTDKREFDEVQSEWLRRGLETEGPGCSWKIVLGHHFIYTGGEYKDNDWLKTHLEPIFSKYRVHMYISGHEHQSQVLKPKTAFTWHIIAGASGDMRYEKDRGNEHLLFLNKKDVAFLNLVFTQNEIEFSFVKSTSNALLFKGEIVNITSDF